MSSGRFITVTIDGRAASGKSTTARKLAQKLNLLHVDTGTHYRAITRVMFEKNISPKNTDTIISELGKLSLSTELEEQFSRIMINAKTFSYTELRAAEVNQNVSLYSAIPEVRNFMLKYERSQEALAKEKHFEGIVMEGRDIGSVVLPNAPFQFFLYADAATRSLRRTAEGEKDSIQERDKFDSQRKVAPLICPSGATVINTSRASLEEVIKQITILINPYDS